MLVLISLVQWLGTRSSRSDLNRKTRTREDELTLVVPIITCPVSCHHLLLITLSTPPLLAHCPDTPYWLNNSYMGNIGCWLQSNTFNFLLFHKQKNIYNSYSMLIRSDSVGKNFFCFLCISNNLKDDEVTWHVNMTSKSVNHFRENWLNDYEIRTSEEITMWQQAI